MSSLSWRIIFFSVIGAVCFAFVKITPLLLAGLCVLALLAYGYSSWRLSCRVKKAYAGDSHKEAVCLKSYRWYETVLLLSTMAVLLVVAYFLDQWTTALPFKVMNVVAGAIFFCLMWGIVVNAVSCRGEKWANVLQHYMVKKKDRPFLQLRLERDYLKDFYTIGRLYAIDGDKKTYICDTIEDTVRDINKNGVFDNEEKKIPDITAIPYGTFRVGWSISQKFGTEKYKEAANYSHSMPWVKKVPNFEGVLIHCGTSEKSSSGCIIVGYNKVVGEVVDSQKAFSSLMDNYMWPAKQRGQEIYLTIK